MEIKPSMFCKDPIGSVLQKSEAETIAQNIMIILKRTGDTFRPLSVAEYEKERKEDGEYHNGELRYFEQVKYLAEGNIEDVVCFSPVWKESFKKINSQPK